ncbi:MarR family transcriptional regulator [uncultured Rubinisphaera sp.]|uniref:MarR family winged helix-turn-helix transcriptional regulator n=1 Tax=uncultured Rubinisphaera sp. TaxID=1678686 RepID=UPI000EBE9D23|nr:MarR family transcriptional regulator [Planctomycetaceae bacterium]|tara:strand:+ start:9720 stop:10220 length:501 start_codon:yes stop_codon:yes gene_type:complete
METTSETKTVQQPGFDSQEQEVFLQLWRTYDCLKALEDQLFGKYDLSAQQYNALRLLEAAAPDGIQTMDLGRRMISRSPDTTRLIDRLEKRGFISRSRREDNRRVVEISISQAGLDLLREMDAEVNEMNQKQLGHLSAQQQQQLVKLLRLARKPHEDSTCDWLEIQ